MGEKVPSFYVIQNKPQWLNKNVNIMFIFHFFLQHFSAQPKQRHKTIVCKQYL